MDTNLMLQSLRDPLGVPFYPSVFQGLLVLTFALHILFVNLVVGGALLAAWGHFSRQAHWNRLSKALARVTTINISIAIVLGVAPLLFMQVIYDPFWYTSNLISAWWAMIFLGVLIIGALAIYVLYLRSKDPANRPGIFGILAVACLCVAGMIMHILAMQALHPERWQNWANIGLQMVTSGFGLHSFEVGRLLHFLGPSLLNTGVFLMLYAWFFAQRIDMDHAYLTRVARLGLNLARAMAILTGLIGLWWLTSLPTEFHFMTDPSLIIGMIFALLLIAYLFFAGRDPIRYAPITALISFMTLLVMCISRESLRMAYYKPFAYSVYDYPQSLDWGSTLLFLVTFVAGLVVLFYLLRIAFVAGRTRTAA